MKLLFDLFPILLFFVAYKLVDIYAATAVAIAASFAQIGWLKLRSRPVEPMQWAGLAIIAVFGGLTLLWQDETFIKWKPTVLYGLFAAVLGGGRLFFGRDLIKAAMGSQLVLPDPVWRKLNLAWMLFFAVMAVLNLAVAYGFSTDTWVSFKLFGTLGLTLAFVVAQAFYVSRFIEEEKP
ncbi:septation protein A [Burkholderiaceae bacterium FT117]|uniref:septation protein A n=1 Tax=Zeimonas sediminis TaxID=2944268 RepID=UPI002342FD98|nr:septation protein A [Zeimonas sediminis]MCM5569224.1 septation protein A [Zeimonas sediminis]